MSGVGLLLVTACTSSTPLAGTALPVPGGAQTAYVVRHVDGDTIVLRGTGDGPVSEAATKVRFLQIDTPEVFGERECFGAEASRRTEQLLPVGVSLSVQADRRLRDRYDRTLLLLWDSEGRSVQEVLVREGAATVLSIEPNRLGLEPLQRAEREAREAGRGLWSACPR